MLLTLLYLALAALILWSFYYIIARVVRSFRGKGGCSCGAKASDGCGRCEMCIRDSMRTELLEKLGK